MKDHECKIKGDVVTIHDDKKSCALWSVTKVEKVFLSKEESSKCKDKVLYKW